jgi:proline dehydrogenase
MFGKIVAKMLPIVPKGVVRQVAKRYVAGEALGAAVATVRRLNALGREATLDILGEDAADEAHADATVRGYVDVLDAIEHEKLVSNISVKPTHLGIRLDPKAAVARMANVVGQAVARGNFVRIDMEDSSLTDATIKMWEDLSDRYEGRAVGTVLQAYLHRTVEDAARLGAKGASLRLCKGIYREPRAIAFQKKEEIRDSYLRTAEVLLRSERAYTGFATHDRVLIGRLVELIARLGTPADRFEFQALLGVPVDDVLDDLHAKGFKVRIYVPFGEEWYAYSTRRLKENPKLATYIVKQMFGFRK